MITIEGRIAPRLDEFMLRLGHMTLLAHLASSIEGRPRRLEKDLGEVLTRPIVLEESINSQMARYLSAKRLCRDSRKPSDPDRRSDTFRYQELEVYVDDDGPQDYLRVRPLSNVPMTVWWQDFCLANVELESAVGAVTVKGRSGSSTGVSHLLDWGVILGILNRDLSGSLEAALLAGLRTKPILSVDSNPFILLPEERTLLAYLLFRSDLDLFSRLASLLLKAKPPIRKSDGAILFGAAVESLRIDAENDPRVSHRAQSVVFHQFKELKIAQKRKRDEPLGASSTSWHRVSSRLESYVDLGLLAKKQDGEDFRFEYAYFPTALLKQLNDSVASSQSGLDWLEGPFIDFFGGQGMRVDRLSHDDLRILLRPIITILGRPIHLFPLEALALGIAIFAPTVGLHISIGGARSSIEEAARARPEFARLSRGIVETRPEFVSLDLEKL